MKRNRGHYCSKAYVFVMLTASLASPAFAQRDMGSIAGTVVDPSQAAVPDARVIITEVDKSQSYTANTSQSGEFTVSPLPVGHYTVRIEKSGFEAAVAGPFVLNVQQRLAVNVSLKIGDVSQQVAVADIAMQLETQTSDRGQVIDSQQMVNLPLNGRNFAQLALLSVGASPAEPGGRNSGTYGFSSNGSRSYQNNYMLDGVDNNSNLTDLFNGTSYVIQPSVDAVQEFKVQTNAYSAEFSRGTGSVVNAAIKSGNNAPHGDLYEFFRNDKLDASNFFATSKPEYRQNQFGGTFGGPVVIPGLYNGRDKTFFFADYEGQRIRQGLTLTGYVPTAAQRGGDFSSLIDYSSPVTANGQTVLDCNGVPTYQGEIFNTKAAQASSKSPTGVCGMPFGYTSTGRPSNIIPTSMMDPAAIKTIQLWGTPNIAGAGYNFESQPVQSTTQNNFDVRIDHRFSDKDSMFGRYSFESQPSTIPTLFQATGGYSANFYAGIQQFTYNSVALSETHIFTPSVVNEFRAGYNRINAHRYPWGYQQNLSAELGIPGIPFGPLNGGLPEFDFSGYSSFGDHSDLPTIEKQNTFAYGDTLTWVHNRNTLKVGTNVQPEQFTISQPTAARGDFSFSQQFTDNAAAPGTGGNSVASFLLGIPTSTQITNIINIDYRRMLYGFFAQDDYRITQRLTLNAGLRWDYFGNVHEAHGNMGSVDILNGTLYVPKGTTLQLPPSLTPYLKMSATGSQSLIPQRLNAFAPRVGLAYQITRRMVFRAGYGIFYSGYENGPWSNPSPGYNPPFYASQYFNPACGGAVANPALGSLNCANAQAPSLSTGIPSNALSNPNTPSLTGLDPNSNTPYVQQWHGTLQYQLPSDMLLEVGYAGSRGTHLYTFFNGNQAGPSTNPNEAFAPRRPYPLIDGTINELSTQGFSSYNSLQTRVEKRFSHGLSFLLSYGWQHSIDNASSANLGSSNNSSPRAFRLDPALDRGNSDFDVRHRFVFSYTYELPFGQNFAPLARQMFAGWRLSGILTLQSGNWYTVTDGNGNFANSDGNQFPNLTGNPNSKPCVAGTLFNTCAFADPALGSFGTAGRNIIQEPGIIGWDNSLFKEFRVTESKRFEFRAEFFNLMNHPNLSTTNLNFGSGSFGFPSAASTPRQIQLALKFYF